MPRDQGFRDPRTLRLLQDAGALLYRQSKFSKNNPLISRISETEREQVTKKAAFADVVHKDPRSSTGRKRVRSANEGQIIVLKDNFVTNPLPTSCASEILAGYVAPQEATVARLVRRAGMSIVAKTNMDEFGMGSHSTHSAFGAVMNGIGSSALSVGGSSGGSALAVAADLAHSAIGTDTGGSVRLPAAYTNLVGFKPSYGLISRHGVVPYANSLDTVGIISKTCLDAFLLFQILNERDPLDPTCLDTSSRERIQIARTSRTSQKRSGRLRMIPLSSDSSLWPELKEFQQHKRQTWPSVPRLSNKRRIGVPLEYNIEEMHPAVRQAWIQVLSMLRNHGHEILPLSLPLTKHALSAYYVLAPAEASSNLAKYDGVRYGHERPTDFDNTEGVLYSHFRGKYFGAEVKRRILLGAYTLSADAIDNYFIQAQKVRRLVQDEFNAVFKMPHPLRENAPAVSNGVDFIICPTAPTPPPTIASLSEQTSVESYMNDVFTIPASLAGLPALSIPAFTDPEMPQVVDRAIGIQVIGQYGDDFSVIQFAKTEIEDYQNWQQLKRLKISQVRR